MKLRILMMASLALNIFLIAKMIIPTFKIDGKNLKGGVLVSNSDTAKRIAEIIWSDYFGKKAEMYKPYTANLEDSVWVVKPPVFLASLSSMNGAL